MRTRLAKCRVDQARLSDEHIEQTHADFLCGLEQWRTIEQERAAERRWLEALLGNGSFDSTAMDSVAGAMRRYFDHLRVVRGVRELLAELSGRRMRMAIVSNWAPSLPEFLDHHGLTGYFDPIVYSAQDGIHKPDPRIFQRALDGLRIPAEHAIFVGDNPKLDIAPARKMGMRAINFDPGQTSPSRDTEDAKTLRELLFAMLDR